MKYLALYREGQRLVAGELKVEGRFSTRFLVESGCETFSGKENRLAEKLSHHFTQRTNEAQGDWRSFSAATGKVLLPMVDLIEQSRLAVDELIDMAGRATIEAVLATVGRASGGAAHPRSADARKCSGMAGSAGRVCLKERKLGVSEAAAAGRRAAAKWRSRPTRRCRKTGWAQRMLDVLMRGISTRQYAEVLPEMASTCGVSKST